MDSFLGGGKLRTSDGSNAFMFNFMAGSKTVEFCGVTYVLLRPIKCSWRIGLIHSFPVNSSANKNRIKVTLLWEIKDSLHGFNNTIAMMLANRSFNE